MRGIGVFGLMINTINIAVFACQGEWYTACAWLAALGWNVSALREHKNRKGGDHE